MALYKVVGLDKLMAILLNKLGLKMPTPPVTPVA
jgi:hypothetical protein